MITGKQLLYPLLEVINDKVSVIPDGSNFFLNPKEDLNGFYQMEVLNKLLLKLQNDEKVLVVTQWSMEDIPDYADKETDFLYKISVRIKAFGKYYKKIQLEPEYKDYIKRIPAKSYSENEVVYWITYSQFREILLNDIFLIGKPDFDSENDLIFKYLSDNPNRAISKNELVENAKADGNKTLHKVVENLGFKGELLPMNMTKCTQHLEAR